VKNEPFGLFGGQEVSLMELRSSTCRKPQE